ncbi:hypothetical protein [Streptomyces sp. NBC_01451]|nr:hypothetical protein [Streptomyces sp. NBC_01451]
MTLHTADRTGPSNLEQGGIVAVPGQRHSLTAETDATELPTVRLS